MNPSDQGTKIAMDGAFLIKSDNGSLTIRKRSLRNCLVLVFLAVCLAGMIALVVASIGSLFQGESGMESVLDICTMAAITGGLAAAILVLTRSMRRPSIHINAADRVIQEGQGLSRRTISFGDISRIELQPRIAETLATDQMAVLGIGAILNDGSTLALGTVSGETGKARARAAEIARLIAETADVEWRAQEGA